MSTAHAKLVPMRWGPPIRNWNQAQTIEETGHGRQLCYESFGGRLFRASEAWVKKGIDEVKDEYDEACNSDHHTIPYGLYYKKWGIASSDFGYRFGYPTTEDSCRDLHISVEYCGPATELYEKFHEDVLLISPDYGCEPEIGYEDEY